MDATDAVPVHTKSLCVKCATGWHGDDLSVGGGHADSVWAAGSGGGGGEAASDERLCTGSVVVHRYRERCGHHVCQRGHGGDRRLVR